MTRTILVILLSLGFHGVLHNKSHHYLNIKTYKTNKDRREQELLTYMHNNGLGA